MVPAAAAGRPVVLRSCSQLALFRFGGRRWRGPAGSARRAPELSIRVNSPSSALAPARPIPFRRPVRQRRIEHPRKLASARRPCRRRRRLRSRRRRRRCAEHTVNSPGPDTRDDCAGGAGAAGLAGGLDSDEAAGRGALNMLVNSPGPDTRDGAAGNACVAGLAGVLGSAEAAGRGALNMLVNSPRARHPRWGRWKRLRRRTRRRFGLRRSSGPRCARRLVNSPGPDTRDDAAGGGCTAGTASVLPSADRAGEPNTPDAPGPMRLHLCRWRGRRRIEHARELARP